MYLDQLISAHGPKLFPGTYNDHLIGSLSARVLPGPEQTRYVHTEAPFGPGGSIRTGTAAVYFGLLLCINQQLYPNVCGLKFPLDCLTPQVGFGSPMTFAEL